MYIVHSNSFVDIQAETKEWHVQMLQTGDCSQ